MTPTSEQEIADILRSANRGVGLSGGGTRAGDPPDDLLAISTRGFSGIIDYQPGTLTLVVRSGTPLSEVEAVLDESGQCLMFEPPRHNRIMSSTDESTIGGVIATNASGPRRVQWGSCRDFVLGTRFVTGNGRILSSGGRVMKNVTGYDLSGLLCGSQGSLAVLTEISIKVLPRSRSSATLAITGLGCADALKALSTAMATPHEITGAAYLPGAGPDDSRTLLRIEGLERSVRQRSAAIGAALTEFGAIDACNDHERNVELWSTIRDAEILAGQEGSLWRINTAADICGDLIVRLQGLIDMDYIVDWAGALLWVVTRHDGDIRDQIGDIPFSATLIRPAGALNIARFHPPMEGARKILCGIKHVFDPRNILNPHIDLTGSRPSP